MEERSRDGGEFKGWRRVQEVQGVEERSRDEGMEERSRDGGEVKGWSRGQGMEERSTDGGEVEDGR